MPYKDIIKLKEYQKSYRAAHRNQHIDYLKTYTDLHREGIRAKHHEYYLQHKEEIKMKRKRYYQNNKKESYVRSRDWRKRNPLLVKKYQKKYSDSHKETKQVWNENNRHKIKVYMIKSRTGEIVLPRIIQSVYENNIKKHGTLTCYLCLKPIIFGKDQIDHKVPIIRGGKSIESNMDIVHKICNARKHAMTELEYRNKIKEKI